MSRDVVVYIVGTGAYESYTSHIKDTFRSLRTHYIGCIDRHNSKNSLIKEALKSARDNYKSSYCIVITDNVMTTHSPEYIMDAIDTSIRIMKEDDVDLFYLFKYMDQCQMSEEKDRENWPTIITTSHSPNGDECIMYSTKARDFILGCISVSDKPFRWRSSGLGKALKKHIEKGLLSAISASPPLFHYDVMNSEDNDDFCKRCECAPVYPFAEEIDDASSSWKLATFVLVVFIVFIVAWALIYIEPKS